MEGTPLSKQSVEAAQRRAGNAMFRGSPTNSGANSPAVSPETSRESVSQSSVRTSTPRVLHTSQAEAVTNYSANRQVSRIPVPSPAKVSQPGPFPGIAEKRQLWQVPSPAQTVDSPQNDISSFALSGEESLTQSVMYDHGETQRQPSSVSVSSGDLDSASGREGLVFNGSMQSPAAEGGMGSMNAVPQSPLVSASAGGSASPDSMPDSAYTGSENHGAHSTFKKEVDADADSIASLGSYLELDEGSGQPPTPGSTIPAISMATEAERPPVSGDAVGFTFSALSVTPTHGSPQNHFFQHQTAHSAPAKRKLVFNTPPPKLCNRKPMKVHKAPVRSLWRFTAMLGIIFVLLAMCLLAIVATQPALWEASNTALGGGSLSAFWQDAAVHAESMSDICQAVAHIGRRYWVIARFHIGSLLPVAAPESKLVDVTDEGVPASNADEVWESESRESSVDLLSSVGNILHQAKDEASNLLSTATAIWEGDDSSCSSAGRLFGTCTVAEAPHIDFWQVCSTENMCMEYSLDGESDARCGLFQPTPKLAWLQYSGVHHLADVPSEAKKMLAAGLSMGYTQLAATWASAKDLANGGVQLQLLLDDLKELVGRWQQHFSFAEQMQNFNLGRHGTIFVALGLLVLTCCVGLAQFGLATRNRSKVSSSEQKKYDAVAPMEPGPSARPVPEAQPDKAITGGEAVTRRRSTRINQTSHTPVATPRPTMSQDQSFCTAASHGYSLRSRPSPYQAQQDLADTAATPSRRRR